MVTIPADGLFIGHRLDGDEVDAALTVDPGDLTTHAVIVGMTGSGKTGLGIDLLEEALLRDVPCLIIDPKGDMGNLLLTFPELRAEDFRPWIEESDAARAGLSPDELAARTAQVWRDGLARSGIGPERIAELRRRAGFTIYTPGSTAGLPLDLIGSLRAPASVADIETLRDEVEGFTSGLLGLIGVTADPLASPEHILISNLVERGWSGGLDLDLATLISQVQDPPVRKIGVLDIDTFYPRKERLALALKLNGLLASPAFASWNQGPAFDIDALLWSDGRPQAAIISIAHLSDAERMFVVTLVLSKVVTWMRAQSGTSELRALIYMDEVFGFAPPTAAPPAKKPILTILKQARAFGVGMVLSTQNPVDLDYKALSNAGTWMIGRLQTERDKSRLLDGMTSAGGGVDTAALDATISALEKRQFLLHSTRSDQPRLFSTRWAMSYLAGPLTRDQIRSVMRDRTVTAGMPAVEAAPAAAAAINAGVGLAEDETSVAPEVAAGIRIHYLDTAAPWAAAVGARPMATRLETALIARVRMLFDDTRADLRETVEWEAVVRPSGRVVDWGSSIQVDYDDRDLRDDPPDGATYVLPDMPVQDQSWFRGVTADLKTHLHREQSMALQVNRELKLYSRAGETTEAFAERCRDAAEDAKDREAATIRDKLAARMDKLEVAIARHQDRIDELQSDVSHRRNQDLISIGSSVLGSILGGATAPAPSHARQGGRRRVHRQQRSASAPSRTASRSRTWPSRTSRRTWLKRWPSSTRSGPRERWPSKRWKSASRRPISAWTRSACSGSGGLTGWPRVPAEVACRTRIEAHDRGSEMKVGLLVPQGWKGEYDGWDRLRRGHARSN